ncbi:hypothetical protein ORV05_04995 [Amycolatopsis cynarae]|uniref:Uncharacterized protein n=1 Tax=Amycolatopsis cynarae TaxID=2995223 RepID=A0ABY7B6U4_9PSEU|nr:hypothetical protein [Amycolatopsis sp. HUAS 11-8]WAL67149.1 hypothetical protein ORV05_04995 [Amycolatopsis sp. HUAS 11-8]
MDELVGGLRRGSGFGVVPVDGVGQFLDRALLAVDLACGVVLGFQPDQQRRDILESHKLLTAAGGRFPRRSPR